MKSDIQPGHVDFNLDVKYVEGTIYNPKTNKYDLVKLRSYVDTDKLNNKAINTEIEFVGPTIEVQPGNTVRVNLANKLPKTFSQNCDDKKGKPEENELNCNNYNITNLHSHGLWISPAGNSDNVLSVVKPGVTFQYEYNIPSDHPAGTFWYHPHLHGSSALQVGSGMSGALIVRG
ncbi:MAG: multicopper oxidase domain-containing protein, partial [Cuspidothrix sp.]